MDFKDKKVLVLGLGRSGFSAAQVINNLGADVWVSDAGDSPGIRKLACDLRQKGISVEIGQHSAEFTASKDIIVLSPGVPSDLALLNSAKKEGTPVISEIELGYLLCSSPIIAVTGTNGKTTVTALIGAILQESGRAARVCGNIGNPFTAELGNIEKDDFAVLEVSSFQLENIHKFKPHIAVILNITPDHLDRYKSMKEYIEAKQRILINQDKTDYALLNYRDKIVRGFEDKTKAKVIFFGKEDTIDHLNDNQRAVFALGSILGVSEEVMFSVFSNFKAVEHRYELVAEIAGVKFINDSKATNINSTAWALNLSDRKVILIAGGVDKGQDFSPVRRWIADKVKFLVLIGEGADKIEKAVRDCLPYERLSSLEEATQFAFKKAEKSDIVLLSPMCASFDMFENYEQRGKVFKQAVLNLERTSAIKNA